MTFVSDALFLTSIGLSCPLTLNCTGSPRYQVVFLSEVLVIRRRQNADNEANSQYMSRGLGTGFGFRGLFFRKVTPAINEGNQYSLLDWLTCGTKQLPCLALPR